MTRMKLLAWTLAGTAAAIVLMRLVGRLVGPRGTIVYSSFFVPLIFVFVASVAAHALRLEGWAILVGPNTTRRSVVQMVLVAFAVGLGMQVGGISILRAWYLRPEAMGESARVAAESMKLVLFRWPGMSPMLLRSLVGSPISEELLVRGCLLSFYQRYEVAPFRAGKIVLDGPNVFSSIAFALFHLINNNETVLRIVGVWFISMFLGRAKRKTGGLLAPMLCHFTFNFVGHTVFQIVLA